MTEYSNEFLQHKFLKGYTPWNKGKKISTSGKECIICNKWFQVKPSAMKKRYCCSLKCFAKSKKGKPTWFSTHRSENTGRTRFKKGQKAWNKGKYTITISTKQTDNYRMRLLFRERMQKEVFARDNYTCQLCGSNKDLQVDHIQSWAEYIELRFKMENCRTLCAKCHYQITFGKPMPKNIKGWGHHFLKGGDSHK